MTTPEECRKYAKECYEWVRKAKTDTERQTFLDMANDWVQAAARQDGRPPIVHVNPEHPNAKY